MVTVKDLARHEAGHAVVALVCGVVVVGSTLGPRGGRTRILYDADQRDIYIDSLIACGGAAAQGASELSSEDRAVLVHHGLTAWSERSLRRESARVVSAHIAAVDAVTAALAEAGRLHGAVIARLAKEACPWLRVPAGYADELGVDEHYEALCAEVLCAEVLR